MKKVHKVVLLVLLVSGCTLSSKSAQYDVNGAALVDIAVRHAVFRYINSGTDSANKSARARAVFTVATRTLESLEPGAVVAVGDILHTFQKQIPWESMSVQDQILIQDLFAIVETNLKNRQRSAEPNLTVTVELRSLLRTAINTSALL